MNKKYRGAVFGATAAIVVVGVSSVLLLGGSKADSDECRTFGSVVTHRVEIKDNKLAPEHTAAKRCEKLLIVNQDKRTREMAFGLHADHVAYDGVQERILNQGQDMTVTLNKTGKYVFHDHLDDAVHGSFTVVQ